MRRFILILLVAFGTLAADARACSCVEPARALVDADGAFVGTVVERTGSTGLLYTFEVEKVYRGTLPPRVSLPSSIAEASCGMDKPVGFRTGVMLFDGEPHVGICNLISEKELDGLATGKPPAAPPAGDAPASLLGALLGTCWGAWMQ